MVCFLLHTISTKLAYSTRWLRRTMKVLRSNSLNETIKAVWAYPLDWLFPVDVWDEEGVAQPLQRNSPAVRALAFGSLGIVNVHLTYNNHLTRKHLI